MKFTKYTLTVIGLVVSLYGQAPDEAVSAFLKLQAEKKYSEAIDGYFGSNPFAVNIKDKLEPIKAQLAELSDGEYGRLISTKKATDTTISDVLREQVYILCYERAPVRFRFIFYCPSGEWIAHSFSIDHDLDEDLGRKSNRLLLSVENEK